MRSIHIFFSTHLAWITSTTHSSVWLWQATSGSSGSCTGESATVATITTLAPDTATTQATQASITTCANLVTVGALASGSIASGFGTINIGTANALSCGSIELGHATDTTLARSAAGVLAVEGVVIPSISSTNTLTNKRVTPRVGTVADAATVTPTGDSSDLYTVTALAQAATIAAPSGTPTNGQVLILRIKDNSTARALTWNAIYNVVGVTLPTTTVSGKTHYIGCKYNSANSKWDTLAVGVEA